VAPSRTILIAGAGIGGLSAALALAQKGFRVVILEQAPRLEEVGAGIQLSPNATAVLRSLGLGAALAPKVVAPEAVVIRSARQGDEITRMPLGDDIAFRFGAPYWAIHRGDLQSMLLAAAQSNPDITLRLASRVTDFAAHRHGITVQFADGWQTQDEHGIALIGADGVWSAVRTALGAKTPARFTQRTAWRATLPAAAVPEEYRAALVNLWLGPNAHLVHYPVRGGELINIVAIVRDRWQGEDWSAAGDRAELLSHFAPSRWSPSARALLELPDRWLKWALCDRLADHHWGRDAVTLLGDAAHPMLPFLAQGAGMAIEDGAVLAQCLAADPGDPPAALRRYESLRAARVRRVQRGARANKYLYHLDGPLGLARNILLRTVGGKKLRAHFDWIYDWRL
jgi:salicylate hydroxylase